MNDQFCWDKRYIEVNAVLCWTECFAGEFAGGTFEWGFAEVSFAGSFCLRNLLENSNFCWILLCWKWSFPVNYLVDNTVDWYCWNYHRWISSRRIFDLYHPNCREVVSMAACMLYWFLCMCVIAFDWLVYLIAAFDWTTWLTIVISFIDC